MKPPLRPKAETPVKGAAVMLKQEADVLYEISMFWNADHCNTTAEAKVSDCGSVHWVQVSGNDAAKTTIHVASEDHAVRLAALINELTSSSQKQGQAA